MLKKAHSYRLLEDFGLQLNARTLQPGQLKHAIKEYGLNPRVPTLYFYDNELLKEAKYQNLSPVVRINALWSDKDIKLKCKVADTVKKKRRGLQGMKLGENEGLFFPYVVPTAVVFHQGSVAYPLDILFMHAVRDGENGGYHNEIMKIQDNTKVGGTDQWSCDGCDCVIETHGGFCEENDVKIGDRLAYFAVSKRDEIELKEERENPMSFLSLAADLI